MPTHEELVTKFNDLESLRNAYALAQAEGEEIFIYCGQEVLTSYAKYLIEYLELKQKHKI